MNDVLRSLRKISILGAWILAAHLPSPAQAPLAGSRYLDLSNVPSAMQRFLLASGVRLRRPGKERITSVGFRTM